MRSPDADTKELIAGAFDGDPAALSSLLDRHRPRLARMVRSRLDPRLCGRVDPSDVIQETLAAASQRMDQYLSERPIPFYPWLRQIAWEKLVHLHDRHLRAAKRSVAREEVCPPGLSDQSALELADRLVGRTSSPSALALRRELRLRVRAALAALPESYREVLMMRFLERMPSKEIAAVMGTSEAAVNMRQMRALDRMRKFLVVDQQGE